MGWLSKLFTSNSKSDDLATQTLQSSLQIDETAEDLEIIEKFASIMTDIDKKFEGEEDFEREEEVPYEEDYENYRYEKEQAKYDEKLEVLKEYYPRLRSKIISKITGMTVEDVNSKLKNLQVNSADFVGEESTEERTSRERHEKFESLKPNLVNMTLSQIASEIGATERSAASKMSRSGLYCLDFDGSDPEKRRRFGSIQPRIICPHCHTKECVRKIAGKGDVVLNTKNLERPKDILKMHCDNCNMDWII